MADASQFIFFTITPPHFRTPLWREPLVVPVYLAALSAAILVLQIARRTKRVRRLLVRLGFASPPGSKSDSQRLDGGLLLDDVHAGFWSEARQNIEKQGVASFVLRTMRFIACVALVIITIIAFVQYEEDLGRSHGKSGPLSAMTRNRKKEAKHQAAIHHAEWIEVALCAFYTYTSLLSLLSITLRSVLRRTVIKHLVFLLLVVFGIYAYRDIWPLATFVLKPLDAAGGWLTWSRIGLLGLAAVVLPVITPAEYTPVDPLNPRGPSPEQTASPLSFILFAFLDPIVITAFKHTHLPYEELPKLADYDVAQHLKDTSFPKLDPKLVKKPKHLMWGLLDLFRGDYVFLTIAMAARTCLGFASPVAVYQLLRYIETGGEGAFIRPWVWVAILFFSPVVSSILMQIYIFVATRILVRVEGILTQLIFEHALRIRVKEDVPSKTTISTPASGSISVVATPKTQTTELPDEGSDGTQRPPSEVGSSAAGDATIAVVSSIPENGGGKDKGKDKVAGAEQKGENDKDKGSNLVGRINNLISTDLENITEGRDFLFVLVYAPLQIALCIWFLYTILGWSSFVGMGLMILSFPIPGKIASLSHQVQVERMKKMDDRVQLVTEIMNVLRMIKMFGWEWKTAEQLSVKREVELVWIRKRAYLNLLNMVVNYVLPLTTMLATFITYTVIMKKPLSASKVFSSLTVFDSLRDQLHYVFFFVPMLIQSKVSVDRVNDFLTSTELLDRYVKPENENIAAEFSVPGADTIAIGFHNATFTWSEAQAESTPATPGRRNFHLRIDGDLLFERGAINLIVGPTGSGKTSLLLALLGELHFTPPGPDSWFNLPRENGIAYSAQEPWILNETIKDNILFGQEFNEERYRKVLYQCALDRDLELFDAGDATEVGEKGLTLSGGQKARISLARAIYSKAEIVLLDDVLSALDVHTSRWIVDNCFAGGLLLGRTLILVTHNIALAGPLAKFVVSIGSDGRIASQGSVGDALSHNSALASELAKQEKKGSNADEAADDSAAPKDDRKANGKLIADEEIALGHVSPAAMWLYFSAMGGPTFWILYFGAMLFCDTMAVLQTWWLGHWASQYDGGAQNVSVPYYLLVYALSILVSVGVYSNGFLLYVQGSIAASRKIHARLVQSILGTTLRFLDKTPIGRIIARFTRDIWAVDSSLSAYVQDLSELTTFMLLKLLAVVYFSPVFLAPGIAFALVGGLIGQIYIKAQLAVKREMSNARSPLFSHFGAAIGGLTSIRAYGAETAFKSESLKRVDKYTRPARVFYNLNRWVCIRIDALGGLFAAGLAAYVVYVHPVNNASNAGLQLNMAIGFTGLLLWWVRILNDIEVSGNSLERIQAYLDIDREPEPTESGKPPASWPTSGNLTMDKLSARYSHDGPTVLHELSFEIKSGEKVGVVGRTGSGKSSMTLSLLRLIPTEGTVAYDGIPTSSLNLDTLRGNITIIPQQPELLAGSIRQNLDPFEQHDDATLNNALRSAGLFVLQQDLEESERITLDSTVTSGGGNFSLGQRQILALARALVRQSKILIMDEATASLDHHTDSIVQESLRTEFKDYTIITVAHRLQTIMDSDKILVLDAGKLIEFDSPVNLLRREGGAFKSLVDGSGDKDALYAVVKGLTAQES